MIDAAADQIGIDAAELRRRNLIASEQVPYVTAFGNTYDSGDFPAAFERALALADYARFAARKKGAKKQGRLRGIGIGCYLEIAGAFPEEAARITFPAARRHREHRRRRQRPGPQDGVRQCGGAAARHRARSGDGDVGDSARDVPGFGAVASRSAMYVGGAVAVTVDKVIEKGKHIAAVLLQAADGDVDYRDGKFSVRGTAREVSLFEAAERAVELQRQGVIAETLDTQAVSKSPPSFPNGCHVAEVEIDADTGAVAIVNYVAVGDCGNVLDDTIVAGQIHGGVAQGLGQALTENTVYDADGQLVSGSFMDYALPRADLMPDMTVEHRAVACRTNPLGVKGTGEAGTTAAPPAVINAILDALPKARGSTCRRRRSGSGRRSRRQGSRRRLEAATTDYCVSIFTALVTVSQCLISPASQLCASASDLLGTML